MPEFNSEQAAVVNATESKIVCLAGAGAGKTFSMISRISKLVEDKVNPQSILVLTFTRAAAFEMKSRYQKAHPNDIFSPEFRTFHGFCYSLISRDSDIRAQLGYSAIPTVVGDDEAKSIKTKAALQIGCKLSQAKLQGKAALTPKEEIEYKIFVKAYKRYMRQRNLITYDELSKGVCQLFKDDEPVTFKYKEKYKYIFVDEFQDTDNTQWEFIQSFMKTNVFVCGDAQQSIYAFRGATSAIIKKLAKDPEWTTYKLNKNYRSTCEICDFANELTKYADPDYRIVMSTERSGPAVVVREIEDRTEFGAQFSERSYNICSDYISKSEGSTAILCRTNAQVDDICSRLDDCEIPYSRDKSDNYTVELLEASTNSDSTVEWLASNLSMDEYNQYIRFAHIHESQGNKYDENMFINDFKNSDKLSTILVDVFGVRDILNSELSNLEKIEKICKLLKLNLDTSKYLDEDVVGYISTRLNVSQEAARIYVGTIHSVKGLEYDNVILLGVGGRSFRLTNEENINLYYVGVTRARNNLVVVKGD